MTPEQLANKLQDFMSRVVAVNASLDALKREENISKDFCYANTLQCLSSEVLRNFMYLINASAEVKGQHAAWACRNLLELSVWSAYCSKSENNARSFYEDTNRDLNGMVDELRKLLTLGLADPRSASKDQLESGIERLAQVVGFDEIDKGYKRVHAAAHELGHYGAAFKHLNVILSKLVHPTAFVVNTMIDDDAMNTIIHMSCAIGTVLAGLSLDSIEGAPFLRPSS